MPRDRGSLRDIMPLLEMFGPQALANMELAAAQAANLRNNITISEKRLPVELRGLEADTRVKEEDALSKPILTKNAVDRSNFDMEKGRAELDFTKRRLPAELRGIEAGATEAEARAKRISEMTKPEIDAILARTAGMEQQNRLAGKLEGSQITAADLANRQTEEAIRGAETNRTQAEQMFGPKLQQLLEQVRGFGIDNNLKLELGPEQVRGARLANEVTGQQIQENDELAPLKQRLLRGQANTAAAQGQAAPERNQQEVDLLRQQNRGADLANDLQDLLNPIKVREAGSVADLAGTNARFAEGTNGLRMQQLLEQVAGMGIQNDLGRRTLDSQVDLARANSEIAGSNARFSDDMNMTKIDAEEARRRYTESETDANVATQGLREAQSLQGIKSIMTGADGQLMPGADALLAEFQKNLKIIGPASRAGEARLLQVLPAMFEAQAKAGQKFSPQQIEIAQRLKIPLPKVAGQDPYAFSLWDLTDPTEIIQKNLGRAVDDIRTGRPITEMKEGFKKDMEPLQQLIEYFQGKPQTQPTK